MENNRIENAGYRHLNGHNCAQAVACAYCDLLGVDETTMFQITSGLGSGIGGMEGTCGAINGAAIVAGMKAQQLGYKKPEVYKVTSAVMKAFKEKNQSVTCKELKGIGTGKILRGCHDCVLDAAAILDEAMKELDK